MLDGSNPVWDVRRGGGPTIHVGKGGGVHRATHAVGSLSRLRRGTRIVIDDGTSTVHAWERARDQPAPVTVQSDVAHPTGP